MFSALELKPCVWPARVPRVGEASWPHYLLGLVSLSLTLAGGGGHLSDSPAQRPAGRSHESHSCAPGAEHVARADVLLLLVLFGPTASPDRV